VSDSDCYTRINIPGFGEKLALVMTGGADVIDFGDSEDAYVTLDSGKRAMI